MIGYRIISHRLYWIQVKSITTKSSLNLESKLRIFHLTLCFSILIKYYIHLNTQTMYSFMFHSNVFLSVLLERKNLLSFKSKNFHEQDNIFSWYNFHTSYVTGRESEIELKSISIDFYFSALFLFHSLSLNRIFFFTSIQNHRKKLAACCFWNIFSAFISFNMGHGKMVFIWKCMWFGSIVNVHVLLCLPVFEVTEDRMGWKKFLSCKCFHSVAYFLGVAFYVKHTKIRVILLFFTSLSFPPLWQCNMEKG